MPKECKKYFFVLANIKVWHMFLHPFLRTLPYALKENLGFKFPLTSWPLLNGNSTLLLVNTRLNMFIHLRSEIWNN